MTDLSPMMKQYQDIKSQHQDAILFFRLGDFYEMFGSDAETASKVLEITLTGRGQDEKRVPMCGIPYHAADSYVAKLIRSGYKVAIAEQMEDPALAKGIVTRAVIKIVTPGTVLEADMLSPKTNNYLAAVYFKDSKCGFAYVDISTGEFKTTELSQGQILEEISRIQPAECLVPGSANDDFVQSLKDKNIHVSTYELPKQAEEVRRRLLEYFKVKSLDSFGLDSNSLELAAGLAVMNYLAETQKVSLSHIQKIQPYNLREFMTIDAGTFRSLEILASLWGDKDCLLSVLDKTDTPMGGRMLKKWLREPLINMESINARLDAVEELGGSNILRSEIIELLGRCYDLERLNGKVASAAANAKDLVALKETLLMVPRIKGILKNVKAKILSVKDLPDLAEVTQLIERAIVDDPPFVITEGSMIKGGYNAELDELKGLTSGGKEWIAKLEATERERSGIRSLKVGFTKVFGYFIEVTNSNLSQVPADYIRKQTLVNAERFITPELKEKEALVLGAEEKLYELEYKLFKQIRAEVAKSAATLQTTAQFLAGLDVLVSLAQAAQDNNYIRPVLHANFDLEIIGGRHPVVERTLGMHNFVPNDCVMEKADSRFLLITGPNMAGKSTYLRQIALIQLMAQIGSFVPAKSAKLPLVDRIFSRIGARDDLASGQSTFMVEMIETANILNNATGKSLIILDEIGRGTSTFDGMSIAYAVAEYIQNKIGAKTLFATHYHELTQIAGKLTGIKNLNTLVKEAGGHVTFLYRIVPGAADKSYGIAVARLAGLPPEVLEQAKEVYERLDRIEDGLSKERAKELRKKKNLSEEKEQIGLF